MSTGYFGDIRPITYEGPQSDKDLAFRHYDPDEMVLGKRMEDHLRFAVAYWHSFTWPGGDPFGGQTFERPWFPQAGAVDTMDLARQKADVAFEMFSLLGRALFLLPRCRRAPRRRDAGRERLAARRDRRLFLPKRDERHGHQAALGHGQPSSPTRRLHGGCRHQSRSEIFAYAAATVKSCIERHQAPRRRELRAVGRPRGLRDAAQHRHWAASSTRWAASSRWSSTTSTE